MGPTTVLNMFKNPRAALGLGCLLAMACSHLPASTAPTAGTEVERERPAREPDVPYEPSSARAIGAMIELGRPGPRDVVYDLGCGDGRVVIEAVKRTGARGVCVELDPKLIRMARENAARAGVAARIGFRIEDLFVTDIRDATVVMLFLWPEINLRLLPKLLKELPPGARIVSNMHDMGSLEPSRVIHLDTEGEPHGVFLWSVPSR